MTFRVPPAIRACPSPRGNPGKRRGILVGGPRRSKWLVLAIEKQYLAESRLLPLARRNGMSTLDELIERLRNRAPAPLATQVVEAMTTNETSFFRDKIPFDHFRDTIMPGLIAARARDKCIRIWCTAASTGQEPYSLAMALKSMGSAIAGYRVDIVATDLSSDVLEKAKAGLYSQFEVQRGLPVQTLVKFFDQVGENWQLAPELRSMMQFRPLNLLNDFSAPGTFDVVFCRNVLIYFDQENKIALLNRIARRCLATAFWYVDALACVGRLSEAIDVLERLLTYSNHLGLFSEDVMPDGSQWGNFPQTYSHVGLMNAVYRIARKLDRPIFL